MCMPIVTIHMAGPLQVLIPCGTLVTGLARGHAEVWAWSCHPVSVWSPIAVPPVW